MWTMKAVVGAASQPGDGGMWTSRLAKASLLTSKPCAAKRADNAADNVR